MRLKKFFFDLSDGTLEPDEKGYEFPDRRAAQQQAIKYAGEMLKLEPERLEEGRLCVVVRDRSGSKLFEVRTELKVHRPE